MTAEDLEKANQLNKKIAQSKKHLDFMKKSIDVLDKNNVPISVFSIDSNGGVGSTFKIGYSIDWLQNEEIKKQAVTALQTSRALLINLFEQDIADMEQQLSNL